VSNQHNKFMIHAAALTTMVSSSVALGAVQLEEIVVTAQKRSENVMEVPISIAAFSADALDKSNVTSTDDLQTVVPGVNFSRQVTAFAPYIRGIGSNNGGVGQEASVAMYLDGIYQSLPAGNVMGFNNVERIEVLKGPQGTLFGRNATGGAISIVTKDPVQETSGRVNVGYGDYDTLTAGFYGTTGIAENLATDLSVSYSDQKEGYDYNVVVQDDVNKMDSVSIRNKWLWQASDNTEVRFSGSYSKTTGGNGIHRKLLPGSLSLIGTPAVPGFRKIDQDYVKADNAENSNFRGEDAVNESIAATLRVDHSFEAFDLVSITGYVDQEALFIVDQDYTPLPLIAVPLEFYNDQFSQEFQFISNNEGPLSWLGGLFFMNNEHQWDPLSLTGLAFAPLDRIDVRPTVETTSIAAFAEIGYELTDATKLTLGIRYTEDEKELSGTTDIVAGGLVTALPYSDDETWSEPTWRVVLDHQLTDDLMGYASYSRGFKSGSYTTVITNGVPTPAVEPETVDAYELGVKGQFFDNTASVTAAIFYYELQDLQVSTQIPGGQILTNGAESEIAGAEFDAVFAVSNSLKIRASIAYTDAEFTAFPDGPNSNPNPLGGNTVSPADLSGNAIPHSPEWTGTLAVDYTLATDFGTFDTNLTYYYTDEYSWEVDNRVKEDAYGLLSAKIVWTALNEQYGIELWGKNLTDEEYSSFTVSEDGLGDTYAPAPPRTYGANVFFNF
jgi:iron complex outermembrane recepter protein